MTLRRFLEYVATMTLSGAVAAFGEPRPVALIVGGAAAVTITFDTIRELGR